jgi:hypothetical protein
LTVPLIGIVLTAVTVFVFVDSLYEEGRETTESILINVTAYVVLLLGPIALIVGFCLGIAGCLQKKRKKLFPVLGAMFNAIVLLGIVMLVVNIAANWPQPG